jgi:hypothetical protein
MATRSTIIYEREDGKFLSIYCHNDGYLEGVGYTLRNYYTNKMKIESLMALGDLSVLKPIVAKGGCVAYGRDRGEEYTSARLYDTLERTLYGSTGQYIYLFQQGQWHFKTADGGWWGLLEDATQQAPFRDRADDIVKFYEDKELTSSFV